MRLQPGDLAPDFELPDQDGRMVSLAGCRGRRLVVYFYPADDTPGCTKEACQFHDLQGGFDGAGAEVMGISADGADSHLRFRSRYGLGFKLLTDRDHLVATRYGAYGEKKLYGRSVVGVIRSTFVIGPGGEIEHAFYGVRADGHAARVLDALAARS